MIHSNPSRQTRSLVVAFVVFFLAAMSATVLVWRSEQVRLQEQRASVADMADDHASALKTHIERALSATYALAALVRQGNGTIANFDAVGSQLMPFYPGVSGLALAPGGIVRSVVPLAGNENALGMDLLNNPATKKEASIARETGMLTLVGPFKLVRGDMAAVGRLPVFLDDAKTNASFWGFINVVIDLPDAFASAGLSQMLRQGFDYELWRVDPDTRHKPVIATSSAAALTEPVEDSLTVPNGTWTLSVAPVKGWGDPMGVLLKAALGLLFSLLFAYLAKLLVDTLKIDRSFVIDMTGVPEGLALVSTIINLAHSLSLKVVAEGVETEEQSRLLRLLRCDEMQGFLFSKPVPGEIFETRFLAQPPPGTP